MHFIVLQLDKLTAVRHDVEEVKIAMGDTIKTTLDSTEKVNDLLDSSKNMQETAAEFQAESTELRRTMQLRSIKVRL